MHRSKKYRARLEAYDRGKNYPLADAFEILKQMERVKFDESVDVAFKLGIDPRQSDQNVRGAVPLPKGTGKSVKVAVVASDSAGVEEAKAAGADIVGMEDLVDKIKGGWLDFDILIATPEAMKGVRPLGRVLGPRGLMPNPKTGTVTDRLGAAVAEAKAGRVEFRNDKGACLHVPIGKVSFATADLLENFQAVHAAVLKARPSTAKGNYLQRCSISSTMSPGIRVDMKDLGRASL